MRWCHLSSTISCSRVWIIRAWLSQGLRKNRTRNKEAGISKNLEQLDYVTLRGRILRLCPQKTQQKEYNSKQTRWEIPAGSFSISTNGSQQPLLTLWALWPHLIEVPAKEGLLFEEELMELPTACISLLELLPTLKEWQLPTPLRMEVNLLEWHPPQRFREGRFLCKVQLLWRPKFSKSDFNIMWVLSN